MALPAQYTESALALYMLEVLGPVADTLGIDELGVYEARNDALLSYGVADVAQATDIPRLRAAARVAAWRLAFARAGIFYQFSADGATYNRQQMTDHIRLMMDREETNAAAVGLNTGGVWTTTYTMRVTDPYRAPADVTGVD